MKRNKRKTALILASVLTANIALGVAPARALNANDVLNNTIDELQQHIINYIFIQNYISGNIKSVSDDFRKKIDYNNDGYINIMDSSHAKNKIIELMANKPDSPVSTTTSATTATETTTVSSTTTAPATTTATETTTTVPVTTVTEATTTAPVTTTEATTTTPVTTTTAPVTTTTTEVTTTTAQAASVIYDNLKVGDTVQYKGPAHYTANGTGKTVDVSGTFKVAAILSGNYLYTVQLENTGWVSYEKLAGKKQPAVTTAPVTTAATTVTTQATTHAGNLKVGDKVQYSGDAHFMADGTGRTVQVSGTFKISAILTGNYLYTVQLENTGWVSYEKVAGQKQPSVSTTPVTTKAPSATTTTAAATTAAVKKSDIKVGDKVQYSGKAYYSASGAGKSVDVSGTFTIATILSGNYLYSVQLEKAGWVSYEKLTGMNQPGTATEKLDGNTYRMKNVSSGKYITAGGTADRSNVYQMPLETSGKTQQFTLKSYYNTTDCYQLFACCSTEKKVMDIVKDAERKVVNGCNVQIYDSVDPDAQTWDIISTGNNRYKIVSHSNKEVAMTVSGSGNGSATGKMPASDGNVYLSTYTGADNQLWVLEKVN